MGLLGEIPRTFVFVGHKAPHRIQSVLVQSVLGHRVHCGVNVLGRGICLDSELYSLLVGRTRGRSEGPPSEDQGRPWKHEATVQVASSSGRPTTMQRPHFRGAGSGRWIMEILVSIGTQPTCRYMMNLGKDELEQAILTRRYTSRLSVRGV